MTFDETLTQVLELLQREGRVTYRALKRRFALDDDYLADLTAELIDAKRLAADEDGKVLVWTGSTTQGEPAKSPAAADTRPRTLAARSTEGERLTPVCTR